MTDARTQRAAGGAASPEPGLRDVGLRIGEAAPGLLNAITDVTGVWVGHVTIWRDEPSPPDGRGVAVLGALWHARDVTGRDDHPVRALPLDDLLERLAAHRRLER